MLEWAGDYGSMAKAPRLAEETGVRFPLITSKKMLDASTSNSQTRNCKTCGKPVIDTGTAGIVHAEGGTVTQRCQNPSCGWTGGQVDKFSNCPRCGDGTQLVDDHIAS